MASSEKHVLFVDDDEEICAATSLMLSLAGYVVATAHSPAEGLKLAKSSHFDLYLLDQKFPDGSGLELCRQIRAFDPTTPILFYSAVAREVDKKLAKAAGAQGSLRKPLRLEDLEGAISRLLTSDTS